MITVNTNMASMLVQKNFKTSTNSLNTAIERLTTGFRINSAKDDAAGKGVAIDMNVKLSSNEVAQNNVSMGVSLLNTAEGNVNQMKSLVQRCRDLCVQARNGTYDTDSQNAIKSELTQLVAQVNQIKDTAEFNGINLFGGGSSFLDDVDTVSPGVTRTFISNITSKPATVVIDEGVTSVEEAMAALNAALGTSGAYIGISNELGLQALAQVVNSGTNCSGKTIVLTDDIDLGSIANWTPIGSSTSNAFNGTFYGNGHTISNMTISGSASLVGLFGVINNGAKIYDIAIKNASVSGGSEVGIIAGYIDSASINNCYVSGTVSGTSYVGGLAGFAGSSTIINSYASGTVSGSDSVGGLVGVIASANIKTCYVSGTVSGNGGVGGLVGVTLSGGSIDNSYASGTVSGNNTVGGLVGVVYNMNSNGNVYINGSAYTSVEGTSHVGGFIGSISAIEPSSRITCSGTYVDNSSGNSVGFIEGEGQQTLNITHNAAATPQSLYLNVIATVGGTSVADAVTEIGNLISHGAKTIGLTNSVAIQAFAQYVNSGHNCSGLTFCLTNDIDIGDVANWTPIGNSSKKFSGTFNGNGHTLSNMKISSSSANIGLFGYVQGATISNTAVLNASVATSQYGGILAGYVTNSTITNSYASGTVSGTTNVGGLAGRAVNSTITNSYVSGTVSGNSGVGGLVGAAVNNSTIIGSYAYNSVSDTGSPVGGFVGYNNNSTYTNCAYVDDSTGRAIGNGSGLNPSGITLDPTATPPSSGGSGITLQIGLDGTANSQITLNLGLDLSSLNSIIATPSSAGNISTLDTILSSITSVETQIGTGLNRLESVQESLQTQHQTLSSALSVVRDADVSQESARYIRSQILQQASASLLTTANQSPSLLLSLINGMR